MNKDAKVSPEQQGEQNKPEKKRKEKKNILLTMKTEPYADDGELYSTRLSLDVRKKYWEESLSQPRQKAPDGFIGWVQKYHKTGGKFSDFPPFLVYMLKFCVSSYWDQLYLNCFIVYVGIWIFFVDGYAASILPALQSSQSSLLLIPALFMLLTQIPPILGSIYFICKCNDLTRLAASDNFGDWAFTSVLIAQYIEKHFFGGINRRDRAGTCRYPEFLESNDNKTNEKTDDGKDLEMGNTDKEGSSFDEQSKEPESSVDSASIPSAVVGNNNAVLDLEISSSPGKAVLPSFSSEKSASLNSTGKISLGESKGDVSSKSGNAKANLVSKDTKSDNNMTLNNEKKTLAADASRDDVSKAKSTASGKTSSALSDLDDLMAEASKEAAKKNGGSIASASLEESDEEESVVADPLEYADWTCLVCNVANHEPILVVKPNEQDIDVIFDTKGEIYKRTFATLRPKRNIPRCRKCLTEMDYQPPLGTAQMFTFYKNQYAAFSKYPPQPTVQAGLEQSDYQKYSSAIYSFFFGVNDRMESGMVANDWRLRFYVKSIFPEVPRQFKSPEDLFEVGEYVDCRNQRSDWSRAKIIVARSNHTYDIRYDAGDELRFVYEINLRLLPEKGSFIYITELMMVVFVFTFPIFCMMTVMGNPAMLTLGFLLCGLILLCYRIIQFMTSMYQFYEAGCLVLFKMTFFLSLPLLLLFIAGLIPFMSSPPSWYSSAIVLTLAKIFSLPLLYMMKPYFASIGALIFIQSCAGVLMVASYADGTPLVATFLKSCIPVLLCLLSLKYLRRHLHTLWDVSLVIRPTKDFDPHADSAFTKLRHFLEDIFA